MKMSQDPGADRVLEALEELGGEGGGLMKAERDAPFPDGLG